MTFAVTYRGRNGDRVVERFEAESREAVFKLVTGKGITPIKVEEAKCGRSGVKTSHSFGGMTRSSRPTVAVAVALFAAVLGGVWWWMSTREKTSVPTPEPPPKRVAPKPKAVVHKPEPKAVAATNAAPAAKKPPAPVAWRNPKVSDEKRLEDYEKSLAKSPLPNTSSNRLFRSGIEQVMGWMFTTEVGDMPPPLPRIPDFDIVHLQEILDSKNEIGESDTEKQADTKETVDFAKAELKKYLEKGGDPDEFLKYYHDQLKTAHQHRQIVQNQVMKVLAEEPERAEEFLKEANKGLAEMGIKAVVIPERIRRRLGLSNPNE